MSQTYSFVRALDKVKETGIPVLQKRHDAVFRTCGKQFPKKFLVHSSFKKQDNLGRSELFKSSALAEDTKFGVVESYADLKVDSNEESLANVAVLLDVQEMMCGACAATVKNILTKHPYVTNATVNLLTETAAVKLAVDRKTDLELLETELAQLVTSNGFPAIVRKPQDADAEGL